jgi:hypothetical protein
MALALAISRGEFSYAGILLLTFSLLSLGFSFLSWGPTRCDKATNIVLGCALAAELLWLARNPPAVVLRISPEDFRPYVMGVQLLCAVTLVLWLAPSARRLLFPTLALAHICIAGWVLHHSTAGIDVLQFQREAAQALLEGRNPYSITFADVYNGNSKYYGEGVAAGGQLSFGYPYLPLSLLLVLPAYLAGDVRYAHVAAIVICAFLLHRLATDAAGRLAAAGFLFTPWIFHLEECGWIDSFGAMLFATTIYVQIRKPQLVPFALGLLLGVKQYMVLVLPAAFRGFNRRNVILACAIATAITLPFLLWDVNDFMNTVVELQFRQPWRPDALSFAVLLNNAGLPRMPWLGFAAAAIASVIVGHRRDADLSSLSRNTAFVFFVFFAFSKQAFYNYYFLVIACLCCSLASPPVDTGDRLGVGRIPEATI